MIQIKFKQKMLISVVVISAVFIAFQSVSADSMEMTEGHNGPVAQIHSINKYVRQESNSQENHSKKTGAKIQKRSARFCERINEENSTFSQKMNTHKKEIQGRIAQREARLQERQKNIDTQRNQWRTKVDSHLKKSFDLLDKRAQTAEQKSAVASFENAIESATKIRREATTKAITNFREGLMKLLSQRMSIINSAIVTMQSNRVEAFNKAKNACEKGEVNVQSMKTELQTEMQSMKNNRQKKMQQFKNIGEQIRALIKTRQQAMQVARDNFKTAIEKAKTDFSATFSKTTTTNSTSNSETSNK